MIENIKKRERAEMKRRKKNIKTLLSTNSIKYTVTYTQHTLKKKKKTHKIK